MPVFNLAVAYLEKGNKAKALEYCEKYLLVRGKAITPDERREIDSLIQKCKERVERRDADRLPAGTPPLVRSSVGAFLLAGGLTAFPAPSSRIAGAKATPNLLLITVDTLRSDRVSAYGGDRLKTPTIDRLAAKGIVFRRAFAQATTTLPSHTNMLLGLDPLRHGVHDNNNFTVGKEFLTLAEHLKAAGYATAAFIGGFPLDSRFGLNRGFDVYDETYGTLGPAQQTRWERRAEAVVSASLQWLEGRGRTSPWFAWVHCYDPHEPYEPPQPFLSQYEGRLYDGEVAYVDSALKKLLDAVESQGWGDNTVIVLTGDHGESLGQHGEETHGFVAYNTTLWIPLIICAPGLKPGTVGQTVTHTDIFPTVCDLLGLRVPPRLQGLSLLPAVKGKKLAERAIYFESMYPYFSRGWAPLYGYMQDSQKFIESPVPELYDIEKDFDETTNLAAGQDLKETSRRAGPGHGRAIADGSDGTGRAARSRVPGEAEKPGVCLDASSRQEEDVRPGARRQDAAPVPQQMQ